jgi:nucleotide-binding universal stress UspA family protein
MSIVCGTDFSEMAEHATTVAAALAAARGEPLHLVHALDIGPDELHEHPGHPLLLWAESRLATAAERVSALGAEVQRHVVAGAADEVVQSLARETSARLVVIGAVGVRARRSRKLGSRADRTARQAHAPVLTVRDSAPFLAWLKEGRSLRVVLGVNESESAESAARWLEQLCTAGPCELVLAHLYWPPEAFHRLGLGGIRSFVEPDAEIVKTLEQQFSQRLDGLLHAKVRSYRIEPYLGRLGDGLALLAAETRADLLVVGCHPQSALERLWEGCVARQALAAASCSVACVPMPAGAHAHPTPKLRQVLAATDFSELGNAAIPLAYAAATAGGTVHLVHVLETSRSQLDPYDIFTPAPDPSMSVAAAAASTRLLELVPRDVSSKSLTTRVHVVESQDAATAIAQAAERLGADVVCLGTHGRAGLTRLALGSVAAGVLAHTRRPVLLARGTEP